MSHIMRDGIFFVYVKTKVQISFAVTTLLISAFVFATGIVQSLFFLNPDLPSLTVPADMCLTWAETLGLKTIFLMKNTSNDILGANAEGYLFRFILKWKVYLFSTGV